MNGIQIVISVVYGSLLLYLCEILRRNHSKADAAATKARREALTRANDSWGEVFTTIKNEHVRELMEIKNEAMKREMAMKDQIEALQEQVDHYEAELARINLINGKLWDAKKEAKA